MLFNSLDKYILLFPAHLSDFISFSCGNVWKINEIVSSNIALTVRQCRWPRPQTKALKEDSGGTFDIIKFLQPAADYHLALGECCVQTDIRARWGCWGKL